MNFIVVPFFLAAQVPDNEITWKNGPEYTYNVNYDTVFTPIYTLSSITIPPSCELHFTAQMKCRPREPDRLHCHFNGTKVAHAMSPIYCLNHTLGNSSFEMKYNEDGLEYCKSDDGQEGNDAMSYNLYQFIAVNMNLWADIDAEKISDEKSENASSDGCPVTYQIEAMPPSEATPKPDIPQPAASYAFHFTKPLEMNLKDGVNVTKVVNLDKCNSTENSTNSGSSTMTLISSRGQMNITSHNFTSETTNTFNLVDSNSMVLAIRRDVIRLTFVSMEPVKRILRTLPNVGTVI
ncbi:uncharacterized protein LOC143259053 [Megalopta genalis]|uniref:uncharacterized protein LOC143259053 n=1 Tax=Megalopta genalis TaxID=115081 RepID=UPI003FD15BB9